MANLGLVTAQILSLPAAKTSPKKRTPLQLEWVDPGITAQEGPEFVSMQHFSSD
jgi:hypothetical protein